MARLKCRCGATLSDNDNSVELLELIRQLDLNKFQSTTVNEILSYFECKSKGIEEKQKWIMDRYKDFLPALEFDDKIILADILTVDFPSTEIWCCKNCGRWWIENDQGKLHSYKIET